MKLRPPTSTELIDAADSVTLVEYERGIDAGMDQIDPETGNSMLLTALLQRQQQRKFKDFVRAVFEEEMGRSADQEPELAMD